MEVQFCVAQTFPIFYAMQKKPSVCAHANSEAKCTYCGVVLTALWLKHINFEMIIAGIMNQKTDAKAVQTTILNSG